MGFADRVSHSVDRPRASLHVPGRARQCPDSSVTADSDPPMHALESESNLIIRKYPGWIISESVRIPVNRNEVQTYQMERYMYWCLNCAYCARLGMTGNSILAPNLSRGNAGTDWEQMKTSGIWGLPNVRNTHSSASSMPHT